MLTDDASLIAALREGLNGAGYTVDGIRALWGDEAEAALERGRRMPAQRALARLRAGGAIPAAGTLAWLFVLGLPVDVAELECALPGVDAQAAGLVAADGAMLAPLVDLRPYAFADARGEGEWWIASDLGELQLGRALPGDHVLGVGGASVTLSRLLIPLDAERALDLGTGCGIQALHLSRFARFVVATDVSERALAFARFNAALNGCEAIEFRLGSLFEPVAGESFDRIVSNPPFVITPRGGEVTEYEYRDAGRVGDALVAEVLAGVGEHLAPGGTAQLLGNWEYRRDAAGLDRVAEWTAGLDAWVVERELLGPAEHAETWIRDGGSLPGSPEFDRWHEAWLDDFERRGVERVGFGYLTVRRPPGLPTLRRFEHVESSGEGPLGAQLAASVAAHDRLAAIDDDALLRERLVVASDVTEERHFWPGAADPTVIVLHQGAGFGRALSVDPALAGFVGACDGELTAGELCGALAALLEVDEEGLRADLLPRVRELVFTGFLGWNG